MIGIKLEKFKKDTMNRYMEFLNPKYVYFSTKNGKVLIEKDDKVLVGQEILETKSKSFVHSSVSGKYNGIVEKLNSNGEMEKFIEIENDFKEKKFYKEKENRISTKEEFENLLKEKGIIGLGGAGFPTFIKYSNNEIKTLIINAVECEPYITADYINTLKHIKEIINTLEHIRYIYNIKEIFIAIKVNNHRLREKIIPYTLKNKFIKLVEVPNLYPMGWEKSLVKYIKHTDYKKLPIEKNIVVSNISTIYSIYEAMYLNKPLIEKIVTISGDKMKKKTNLKIKIGTEFNEIAELLKGYKGNEVALICGGPMMGKSMESDHFILENNVNSILALKVEEIEESICLRCGKCSNHCPAKICPVLIKDNIDDIDELKRLDVKRCIECGICSFICPAKINLREYVKKAKEKVK